MDKNLHEIDLMAAKISVDWHQTAFKDFAKENDKFEVKALSVSGQLLDKDKIDVLAKLPTLDQALGMLASVMIAPVTKLVRTFNEVPTKVTRVVAAVGHQDDRVEGRAAGRSEVQLQGVADRRRRPLRGELREFLDQERLADEAVEPHVVGLL